MGCKNQWENKWKGINPKSQFVAYGLSLHDTYRRVLKFTKAHIVEIRDLWQIENLEKIHIVCGNTPEFISSNFTLVVSTKLILNT